MSSAPFFRSQILVLYKILTFGLTSLVIFQQSSYYERVAFA